MSTKEAANTITPELVEIWLNEAMEMCGSDVTFNVMHIAQRAAEHQRAVDSAHECAEAIRNQQVKP